jgi:hypothetical protein
MSEMVERVARAMYADTREGNSTPVGWLWDHEPAELRENYLSNARAAIAAMREPTPEMVETGNHELQLFECNCVYTAMIDEALK